MTIAKQILQSCHSWQTQADMVPEVQSVETRVSAAGGCDSYPKVRGRGALPVEHGQAGQPGGGRQVFL